MTRAFMLTCAALAALVTVPTLPQAVFADQGWKPDKTHQSDPSGPPIVSNTGGPDAFGYRWRDSDESGGPIFSWIDITSVGTPLALTGDDEVVTIPLPFSFSLYGNSFNQVTVCTNGWMSFTDAIAFYDNTVLPDSGAGTPRNLVAPYWDDFLWSGTHAYSFFDGSRFIISWVDVQHIFTGGSYSFQAILYPDGTIDYQYLTIVGGTLNSETIGIQNATGLIGLQVAFNAPFVHDGLRVRISTQTTEICNGLDDDGDGLVDEEFPDRDGDGIADCVETDDDSDAVADADDNCPLTRNTSQADANGNGIGDACESGAAPVVNGASSLAITIDGQFGPPTAEWFGVTPVSFPGPSGPRKVYPVVDGDGITLMYDDPGNKLARSAGKEVGPVSFQIGSGQFFDVFVTQGGVPGGPDPNTHFGPNPPTSQGGTGDKVRVLLNGVPFDNSAGCVVGAIDHNGTSPDGGPDHNLVELRVRLTGLPGGCYSPEPAFWSATLPTVQPVAANGIQADVEVPSLMSSAFFTVDSNGTTTIVPIPQEIVTGALPTPVTSPAMLMAAPNPFVQQTSILFALPVAQEVEVSVSDVSGRRLWRSQRSHMEAGLHRVSWHGEDYAGRSLKAGVYFVRVHGERGLDLRRTVVRLR